MNTRRMGKSLLTQQWINAQLQKGKKVLMAGNEANVLHYVDNDGYFSIKILPTVVTPKVIVDHVEQLFKKQQKEPRYVRTHPSQRTT